MNDIARRPIVCIGGPMNGQICYRGGELTFTVLVRPPMPLLAPSDGDQPAGGVGIETVTYRLQIIATDSGEAYPIYVADDTDKPLDLLLDSYTARARR